VTVAALRLLIILLMHTHVGCTLGLALEPASALTVAIIKPRYSATVPTKEQNITDAHIHSW